MTTVAESLGNTPLNAALVAGYEQLSANQTITFTQYNRVVLPIDGFVFWVNAKLLSPSAILNTSAYNTLPINQVASIIAEPTLSVSGSLHYSTSRTQGEDETIDVNRVVFTTATDVDIFNVASPNTMFLAEFDDIRFTFSARGKRYQQAGLFHYIGDAVYPALESQIVDTLDGFDTTNSVVSNSLPIWLSLNGMAPTFPYPPSQYIPLYPSFAVPNNLIPTYGAVHVVPDSTVPMQATPYIDTNMNQWQLVKERVRITFYGLRNFNVLDFMAYVQNFVSQDGAPMGIMNVPAVRDAKRTQSEMSVLAMKKTIEYEVNYYQQRARNIAQQLILSAIPTYIIGA